MSEPEWEPTPEQDVEAMQLWGRLWDMVRDMISEVALWKLGESGPVQAGTVEVKAWADLDEWTQAAFIYLISQSPAMDTVGAIMAKALTDGPQIAEWAKNTDKREAGRI